MTNKEFFIHTYNYEIPAFLACIKAVPDSASSYTPHPKSRTARQIIEHIIGHPLDMIEAISFSRVNHHYAVDFTGTGYAANLFKSDSDKLIKMLSGVSEDAWDNRDTRFFVYGNEIEHMRMPLGNLCWALLLDMIHHRGQLSTYYRPMGTINPSIYGPTREMTDKMMEEMQLK